MKVGYFHMNPAHGSDDGAILTSSEELISSIMWMTHFNQPFFAADPELMRFGVIPLETPKKAYAVVDDMKMNGAKNLDGYSPLVIPSKEEMIAMYDEIMKKNPEWKIARYYFNGEVLTAPIMIWRMLQMDHGTAYKPVEYDYSLEYLDESTPFFQDKDRAIRVFKENPEKYPGWEVLAKQVESRLKLIF